MNAKELRRRQRNNQAVARCIPVFLICATIYASWVFVGPLCGMLLSMLLSNSLNKTQQLRTCSGIPPEPPPGCARSPAHRAWNSPTDRLLLPSHAHGSELLPPALRRHIQPRPDGPTPSTPRTFAKASRFPRTSYDHAVVCSHDHSRLSRTSWVGL